MPLLLIGVNHRTAPVEVRERLNVSEAQLPDLIQSLTALGGVAGIIFGWITSLIARLAFSTLPVAVLFTFLQRHLIRGLTAGALKG